MTSKNTRISKSKNSKLIWRQMVPAEKKKDVQAQ